MTQRQLHLQSPPSMGDSSQSWEPGETAQPVDGSTGWRMSYPGASVGLTYFQTAGSRLAPLRISLQLSSLLTDWDSQLLLLSGREGA